MRLRGAGLPHDGEGSIWVFDVIEKQPDDRIHITCRLISHHRIVEVALRLLGLGELGVELGAAAGEQGRWRGGEGLEGELREG